MLVRACVGFGQQRKFPSLLKFLLVLIFVDKAKELSTGGGKARALSRIGAAAKDAVGEILLRLLRQAVPGHPRRPEAPPAGRPAPARPRPLVRHRPPPRSAA